jgi:RNA polymerase sigma-70 factor (ECF subfamily)
MIDGEAQLVVRATQGDSSAFGELYDNYQPRIYRFVLLKVSKREEAEDLTHQVFMHAWQNIGNYRNMGYPFSSWLYRIARNQVIDFYRTNKNDAPLDEMDPESFPGHTEGIRLVEVDFEMDRVREALKKLKAEYQDVVIMRFIEELSIKETAAAIKKSEGAVKLIQHRALKQLKDMLEQPQILKGA